MAYHARKTSARGNGKTKSSRKQQRRQNDREFMGVPKASHGDESNVVPFVKKDDRPFVAKTPNQQLYYDSLFKNTLTFGIGPAGTGKTYCAVLAGCEMLQSGRVERMVFTRPATGAEEELGFFKGDLDEKLAPWVAPIREILNQKLGSSYVEYLIKREVITFQPFATMRGHSWKKCFIMLDEAQNTTANQMKMFLTRVGEDSVVVVDGDFVDQKDIDGMSGLEHAYTVLKKERDIGRVEFGIKDIVRSGFVKRVIMAYHAHESKA